MKNNEPLIIIDSFLEKVKEYCAHKDVEKPIIDWLKVYYKDLFKKNKKLRKSLNSKLSKLSENQRKTSQKKFRWFNN